MYVHRTTRYHPIEPHWQDHRQQLPSALKQTVKTWLLDKGSLTQRLIQVSGNRFAVRIIRQHWQRPYLSEARLLDMNPRHCALVREVALLCAGQPWVFARSILPGETLSGKLRYLRHFGNQSLGQLLFNHPDIRRDPFQVARIDADSAFIPPALRSQDKLLWGRRSRFILGDKSILVAEIFLPRFIDFYQQRSTQPDP